MKAIILAAGFGKRLMPLTKDIPKPLLPVLGKPMIQRNIEWLKANGIKEIAINLHHLPSKIMGFLGDGSRLGVKITYSVEKNILGTAGGIKKLERFVKGTFMACYGDNITNLDVKKLLQFHKRKKGIATICLHEIKKDELKDASIVNLSRDSKILSFVEKPNNATVKKLMRNKNNYSNAGIYILEPSVLSSIEKNKFSDFSKDIFPKMLDKGKKMYGYPLKSCFWAELGTFKKYKSVINHLEKHGWK